MFAFDTDLTMQVFLLDIYGCHFGCKVFCLDCNSG